MPIKTIQPFVSDFNAFAGEGFYGNVVQGLVIKQLEDVVFIFGIAIDGTLIFRKRNYPDVSTWEDSKIIIHSNNWHKIYSKRELGGLIGIEKIKKTVTATLEGSIIYLGDIGYNSYIVSCNDGGMPFNLIIISNSGNINYNIINGMIRRGYSINVDGDKKQYLKIKRDETVIDKDFNFTFFRVI